MASSTTSSLSFRPWTAGKPEETALQDVLARVNVERGHFRDITEASLQEEIATEGALELSSSDEEEDEQNLQVDTASKRKPPSTQEELVAARNEMLFHVGTAQNDIAWALEFTALLQSKYNPGTAAVSISQDTKKMIPLGSLGVDVWDPKAMPVDDAREAQDALLASRVRLESLQQSADALLAAATRLQDNVRKEKVFWDEVLSVSEKGWSVSRIPGRDRQLGVHFGFNGCAPEFAGRTVAALAGDSEGTVSLARGIGTKPRAVRAVIKKDGLAVGSSRLPSLSDEDETPLDVRIHRARDSVFDEELYHELLREARNLASFGVSIKGGTVSFTASQHSSLEVELELVPLDQANSLPLDSTHSQDALAQGVLLAARLLLGQKHRDKLERKRREIPIFTAKKSDAAEQSFAILRPLMLILQHHGEVSQINSHLQNLSKILRLARVSAETQDARIALEIPSTDAISIETLITSLARPFRSEGVLWVIASDDQTLELKFAVETSAAIDTASRFIVTPPEGKETTFDYADDARQAVDDFLALALGQALKKLVDDSWTLDVREGLLTRTVKNGGKDSMWFTLDGGRNPAVTLSASSTAGSKHVTWKLDESGDSRVLGDVWKELVK